MTGWNEYDAALHCLMAPSIFERVSPFIEERGFDWDGIEKVSSVFSSGEQVLVDAARTFWNAPRNGIDNVLGRALWTLDEANSRRLVEAILIYTRIGSVDNPALVSA